ncbi:Right handed beta helix region [Arthrobacter sp. OV608]|nr:Right handed beta helix region [Arthrobacter sp. OV608]
MSALTSATAISAFGATSAQAAPGDKTPPNTYVPVAEKGSPAGVATLDANAQILPTQLPDLSAKYAPAQILVESHALSGDASDDLAWARAIGAARAASALGGVSQIVGSKECYEFASPVDIGGLAGVTIRGRQGGRSTVKAKAGAGVLESAFRITNGSGDASDITIENFLFDGGLTNGAALGTSPARVTGKDPSATRVFATDRLASAIKVRGDNVPNSASTYPSVGNVTIRRVKVYGMESLPVLISGVRGHTVVTEYVAERSLDTGFTHNESVTFMNNRVYYSADNGVSLSRGNKNVICVGNTFSDSWFYGVFISGFDKNAGPVGFVCTGNDILRSYEGGIGLFIGPTNGVVTGNTIDTVYRGTEQHDANSRAIGVGIRVGGYVPVAGDTVGPLWCRNVLISGNEIIDAARGGILVTSRSTNIDVVQNVITRPGSTTDSTGATVGPEAENQNFGILLSGGDSAADWGEIRVKMNTIVDDRDVPLTNRGTFITSSATSKALLQFNVWSGTRVQNDEKSDIGPRAVVGDALSSDTRFEMVSANGALKSVIYRVASGSLFRIATTSDSSLEVGTYQTIGSSTVTAAMQVNRALSQVRFMTAPRLPSYTTATRPKAATVTAGAQIYDSTLGYAVTSNGADWVNGIGTVV